MKLQESKKIKNGGQEKSAHARRSTKSSGSYVDVAYQIAQRPERGKEQIFPKSHILEFSHHHGLQTIMVAEECSNKVVSTK